MKVVDYLWNLEAPSWVWAVWAVMLAIPGWGWFIIGVVLALALTGILQSIRDRRLIREIQTMCPEFSCGFLLPDWTLRLATFYADAVRRERRYFDTSIAEAKELYISVHERDKRTIFKLQGDLAAVIDERAKLMAALDKSHKRPRDAKGHFIKESKTKR